MRNPLPQLTTTGRPEHQELEANMRRALDQLRGQVGTTGDYAPGDATQWVAPPPTSIAEALDRLAVACVALGHMP